MLYSLKLSNWNRIKSSRSASGFGGNRLHSLFVRREAKGEEESRKTSKTCKIGKEGGIKEVREVKSLRGSLEEGLRGSWEEGLGRIEVKMIIKKSILIMNRIS